MHTLEGDGEDPVVGSEDNNSTVRPTGTSSTIRRGFVPVIRKMLLFPLVTLVVWSIPMVEVFFLAFVKKTSTVVGSGGEIRETVTQVAINLQGLTNCIILMLTNSLVRNEISRCCCGGGGGGRGGVGVCFCLGWCRRRVGSEEEDGYDSSVGGDDYLRYEDEDEDESRYSGGINTSGSGIRSGGSGPYLQHSQRQPQYGDSFVDEPLFVSRRTEPAHSEDVSIMRFVNHRNGSSDDGSGGGGGSSINSSI